MYSSLRNKFSFRRHAKASLSISEDFLKIETSGIVYPSKQYNHEIQTESKRFLFEYIVSGKGYIDCDGRRTEVNEGDFVLIRFEDKIRYFSDPDDPYTKIWFTATGRFAWGLMLSFGISEPVTVVRRKMFSQFESFISFIDSDDFSHEKASVKLLELMLYAAAGSKSDQQANRMPIPEQVKLYIDIHFREKPDMKELSERFNQSEKKLRDDFKIIYGISPCKYIRYVGLETAKNMLETTECTVAELAVMLNYSSAPHLSKDFYKEYGVYPTEYRKRIHK